MINLGENYLLFIEPDNDNLPDPNPVNDEWVDAAKKLLSISKVDIVYSANPHQTKCNRVAYNAKVLLPNGVHVHSLMPYYLQCYRKHIPESELIKFKVIADKLLKLPSDYLKFNSEAPSKPVVVKDHEHEVHGYEMPKLKVQQESAQKESKDVEIETKEQIEERLKSVASISLPEPKVIRKTSNTQPKTLKQKSE